MPITSAMPDDPRTAAVVSVLRVAAGRRARRGRRHAAGCRSTARSPRLRASETNLGNLVADAMRADAGADIAIVNSRRRFAATGCIGAGPLTRRTLLEIHPFGNVVCKVAVSGPDRCSRRSTAACRKLARGGRAVSAGLGPDDARRSAAAPPASRVSDVRIDGTAARSGQDLHRRDSRFRAERRRRLHDVRRPARADLARVGQLCSSPRSKSTSRHGGEVAPAVDGRITIAR